MFDNDYIPGFRKIGKSDNWILYEFDDEPSKSFILVKEPRFYYMYVNKKQWRQYHVQYHIQTVTFQKKSIVRSCI